jgi:hypothetical protein
VRVCRLEIITTAAGSEEERGCARWLRELDVVVDGGGGQLEASGEQGDLVLVDVLMPAFSISTAPPPQALPPPVFRCG